MRGSGASQAEQELGGSSLDILRIFCPGPVPLTMETHERALQIAERYGYSIFDSLTIAAALHSGAGTLYSEDLHDGQRIDDLTIRNPFSRYGIRTPPLTEKREVVDSALL